MKYKTILLTLLLAVASPSFAKPSHCIIESGGTNYKGVCDVKPTDNKGSFILTAKNYKAKIKVSGKDSAFLTDNEGKKLHLYKDESDKSCWIEDVWPSTICVKPQMK